MNESNYLITSTYKISTEIINLNKITSKSIFDLITKLRDTVRVDYILYFEKNPVMDNYLILKYDTCCCHVCIRVLIYSTLDYYRLFNITAYKLQ